MLLIHHDLSLIDGVMMKHSTCKSEKVLKKYNFLKMPTIFTKDLNLSDGLTKELGLTLN